MLKTLTFAILHFGVAFGVAFALTGDVGISGGVALIEPLVNTVVFYVHEKIWRRVERKNVDLTRFQDCGHRSMLSAFFKLKN